jgi:integrase
VPSPDTWGFGTDTATGRRNELQGRHRASRRHLRFFAGRSAGSVTGADVTRYADLRRGEGAAAATVNRELAALRRAFRLVVRQGLIAMTPPVTTIREDNVRIGFFEPDQLDAVCRHLGRDEAEAVRFMAITRWRSRSEVFLLTWAQVDWSGGLIRLEP